MMSNGNGKNVASTQSSLRWKILRGALLHRPSPNSGCPNSYLNACIARLYLYALKVDILIDFAENHQSEIFFNRISRKTRTGFDLIPWSRINNDDLVEENSQSVSNSFRDACYRYTLPVPDAPKLFIHKRADNCLDLNDFEACNRYDIDNTGLVCQWPSEDVLAYYCLSDVNMFRNKRVIELGSGYGLAGLVVAIVTDASEVVISDGNPQVVDYIQRNIDANSVAFCSTKVTSMMLHWDQNKISSVSGTFDIVIASDCTFFKEFHKGLVQTIRCLLKEGPSEAILFSPKRGDSLDKFLVEVKDSGLNFTVTEVYDNKIWRRHQIFLSGDNPSWPNYDADHCYPLFIRITH